MVKKIIIVVAGIILFVIGGLYVYLEGFKTPSKKIKGSELGKIDYLEVVHYGEQKGSFLFENSDSEYFNNLSFKLAKDDFPGNTPDYNVELFGDNEDGYLFLYSESEDFIFLVGFSGEYGFFSAPAPGGWIQPIYFVEASEELLKIVHIK